MTIAFLKWGGGGPSMFKLSSSIGVMIESFEVLELKGCGDDSSTFFELDSKELQQSCHRSKTQDFGGTSGRGQDFTRDHQAALLPTAITCFSSPMTPYGPYPGEHDFSITTTKPSDSRTNSSTHMHVPDE